MADYRDHRAARSRSRDRQRYRSRSISSDRYDQIMQRPRRERRQSRDSWDSRDSPRRHRSPRRPLSFARDRSDLQREREDYRSPHQHRVESSYRESRRRSPPPLIDELPERGRIYRSKVVSVRPFGVFVELEGFRKQGLVHHSQISEEVRFGRDDDDETRVKSLEYFLPPGETTFVKVLEIRGEGRDAKIGCSMKAVDQKHGTDLDPDNLLFNGGGTGTERHRGGASSDLAPALYSIHKGTIQSVKPFGVFVQLEGFRKYGLVHTSQISDHLTFTAADSDADRIAAVSEVVGTQGEKVWVKVVDVTEDERGPKIACSLKLVSQRDGADLDPHNVKYKPRGGDGSGPGGLGQGPVGGTVGGTTSDALVEWGHLKADVVQYGGGGRQYDILPAMDEGDADVSAGRRQRGLSPELRTGMRMGMPPRGRGMGNVLPAWMAGSTTGGAAPGSAPGGKDNNAPITSVEDALAVLEELGAKHKHKKHKHKHKKEKKHRKSSKKSSKKHRRRRRSSDSGSSSSGGSGYSR